MFYIVAFNIGEQVRNIPSNKQWLRRIGIIVVIVGLSNNVYTLFDLMPNKILFPIYAVSIAAMLISAMNRYEYTTPYSFGFIFVGGLLFVISDNLLGFLKFNHIKTDIGKMFIMLTYYSAQFIIMHGSLHHSNLQH